MSKTDVKFDLNDTTNTEEIRQKVSNHYYQLLAFEIDNKMN